MGLIGRKPIAFMCSIAERFVGRPAAPTQSYFSATEYLLPRHILNLKVSLDDERPIGGGHHFECACWLQIGRFRRIIRGLTRRNKACLTMCVVAKWLVARFATTAQRHPWNEP